MIALVVIMHALLAAIFPIGRAAVQISQPVFFTGIRMMIGGVVLLGYHYLSYGRFSSMSFQLFRLLCIFMITGIYLTNVPEFWALQWIPAAKASFIYSLSPFVAALFSYFLFNEKMTWKKVIGMLIGLSGFSIMIYNTAPGELEYYKVSFFNAGEMALIMAAISSAYGWIVMRQIIRKNLCTGAEAIGYTMFSGGVLAILQSLVTETWNPLPTTDIRAFLMYVTMAALFSSILGYVLYPILLKYYSATFLSFAGFVEPLCAALFAWIFLGEIVTWKFYFSSVLVVLGLYIFYQEELKQGYIIKYK